ncbi:MAG: helix-turn-helix domain-containing protein [Sediminibacterium sp.]
MNITLVEKYNPRILPSILRINEVIEKKLMISVLFSTGENMWLDFNDIFNNVWKSTAKDFEYPLKDSKEFKKVILEEGTLTWKNIQVPWTNLKGEKEIDPFAVGPDTLYELSYPYDNRNINIGEMLRLWRTSAELTQAEVARRSGTSRSYITKIEAGRQDIELGTLSRIVQATFGKSLNITLK